MNQEIFEAMWELSEEDQPEFETKEEAEIYTAAILSAINWVQVEYATQIEAGIDNSKLSDMEINLLYKLMETQITLQDLS
jgi:hypothetical protein